MDGERPLLACAPRVALSAPGPRRPTPIDLPPGPQPDHAAAADRPAGSIDVLGLVFYRTAFEGGVNAIGMSSALAVLMFVFIFGIALVANRFLRRREAELS